MSVVVILDVTIKPEALEQAKGAFDALLPDTRAYEGCEGFKLCYNQDDPNNVTIVEVWETRAHYEKYLGWRQETGVLDQLGAMSATPASIRYYDYTQY